MVWITKGFRHKGNRQGLPGIVIKVSVTAHGIKNGLLLAWVRLLIKFCSEPQKLCRIISLLKV